MRIFLVEDEQDQLDFMLQEIARIGEIEINFSMNKYDAEETLKGGFFYDLVILDLQIPFDNTNNAPKNEHGLALYSNIISAYPGTPVIVFSGHASTSDAVEVMRKNSQQDIFGSGALFPMTDVIPKTKAPEVLEKINLIYSWIKDLNRIEIGVGLGTWRPDEKQSRILQLFAKQLGGSVVQIKPLSGGLSSFAVLDVNIYNSSCGLLTRVAGRIAKVGAVIDESERYNRHISRLKIGKLAHKVGEIRYGGGDLAGIFYYLAGDYPLSLFELLRDNVTRASQVVNQLKNIENTWYEGATIQTVKVKELRKLFISDEDYKQVKKKLEFDTGRIDSISVRIKTCSQHKDSHGLNILVDRSDGPLFIDYGDSDFAPACTDAIILELSTIFHPAARVLFGSWASFEDCSKWEDLDAFAASTPFAEFIKACRTWAFDVSVGVGDKAVYAVAYCYAIRQLKYDVKNHPLAVAIAKCAADKLLSLS